MTVRPELTGVPETTLWTLHNRATEARRPDSALHDPWAVAALEALTYPYAERFGRPNQSHALRARTFDDALRAFLAEHPDATVVALGEGLQTTYWRLGEPAVDWISVDLPEVLALREQLLPAADRIRPVALSALDRGWMDRVGGGPTIVTAEGLLMYFTREEALGLLADCAARFPGGQILFDTIPPWFSRRTVRGLDLTPAYRAPAMPFGITVPDVLALPRLVPGLAAVDDLGLASGRGPFRAPVVRTATRLPVLGAHRPGCFRARSAGRLSDAPTHP
ncbi:class I SAM-dependent methyltransferase [Actinomycetospora aeridis]|uniref:Class I SAM-dependent methyltransferase n=1 Tax=Actinomycetospora aeridis TaxID=3129231 RepID=A0ABU8MYB7_9PSEU